MGVTRGFVKAIEDPTVPGKHITIRMLSYFQLEEARKARLDKMREQMKLVSEFRSTMPPQPPATPEQAAAALERDPLVEFDVLTLLQLGVESWTHEGALDVSLFDEVTAPHVAKEILRYSKPEAAELGKASSSSTAT